LKSEPGNAQASVSLAELLCQQGQTKGAVELYERVIAANPKLVTALNNLAWMLATSSDASVRDGPRAVALAERACQLTEGKAAVLIGTLAAAYAEAGRFTDAVSAAEKARDLARTGRQEETAKRNEALLELYCAGKPFHGE
jgi:tetratricopeptide (TPR) repeat protein